MTRQPESRIVRDIREMVEQRGGFCFKVHGSEFMMAGLPDLVCCYRGLFIGFEVKTPSGVVSRRQRYVMTRIMNAQGIVTVPRDVTDASAVLDVIDDVIQRLKFDPGAYGTGFAKNDDWRK